MTAETVAHRQAVLEQRARRLARTDLLETEAEGRVLMDLALVRVAGREIGLPTTAVREILTVPTITPLPAADRRFAGLAQVRGRILAVADLGVLLGDHASGSQVEASGRCRHLVLVDTAGGSLGLLVDQVAGFRQLRSSDLAEDFRLGEGGSPVQGITRDLLLILDVDRLLPEGGAR